MKPINLHIKMDGSVVSEDYDSSVKSATDSWLLSQTATHLSKCDEIKACQIIPVSEVRIFNHGRTCTQVKGNVQATEHQTHTD